jgi:nicotinic acid phosphoribosyltransferase
MLESLYRHSLALLTDLYQLTMACGYWKHGLQEREAVVHPVGLALDRYAKKTRLILEARGFAS